MSNKLMLKWNVDNNKSYAGTVPEFTPTKNINDGNSTLQLFQILRKSQ